MQAVHSYRR